jgi:hypothetical protein
MLHVVMLRVPKLSFVMENVIILFVVMQSVIILSLVYQSLMMLRVVMLSIIMLSLIMLCVVMLSVIVAPKTRLCLCKVHFSYLTTLNFPLNPFKVKKKLDFFGRGGGYQKATVTYL